MEPHVFGLLEPEIEKKPGAGATPKKMRAGVGSSRQYYEAPVPVPRNKKHNCTFVTLFYVK